jgi:hypothetical protein
MFLWNIFYLLPLTTYYLPLTASVGLFSQKSGDVKTIFILDRKI